MGKSPELEQADEAHGDDAARVLAPRPLHHRATRVRKRPRQARSRQMVEAILQAAAELFAELGHAGATTNKIAARAGVSVGSLYQYFPDKDSLLESLLAEHHEQVDIVVRRSLAALGDVSISLDIALGGLLDGLLALHHEDPVLTRALAMIPPRNHEPDRALARAVVDMLARRPDVRTGPYPLMAAITEQITANLSRWMVHHLPAEVNPQIARDEILTLLVGYLKCPPRSEEEETSWA